MEVSSPSFCQLSYASIQPPVLAGERFASSKHVLAATFNNTMPRSHLLRLQLLQVLFHNSDLAIRTVDASQQLLLRLLYHVTSFVVRQRRRDRFHLRVVRSRRLLSFT